MSDEDIQKVFGIILAFGNYMNGGKYFIKYNNFTLLIKTIKNKC